MQVKAELIGVQKVKKYLKKKKAESQKALQDAIKIEGFRLRKELGRQMRSGSPGGASFAPLSVIARRWWHFGRMRRNNPLTQLNAPFSNQGKYSLEKAIRYGVSSEQPFAFKIGWTNDFLSSRLALSKSWLRIAKTQQEGFKRKITPQMRKSLIRRGAELGPKKGKYFFIKKTTTEFKTPPRKIIRPFWASQRPTIMQHIKRNYIAKMSGLRV